MTTTSSTLRRSFPTFRRAAAPIRWAVRTRRRRWTTAAVLLAIAAAPVLWWSLQLAGLPDIGDRIVPEPPPPARVPPDRDAAALYLRAEARYTSTGPPLRFTLEETAAWSKAPEGLRRLVEENGEAMALYREAADRPEISPPHDRTYHVGGMFHWLAFLEASRREEAGDMVGAWTWYRALLRSIHHGSAYASYSGRIIAQDRHDRLLRRLEAWAADPRTTLAMLRQALDDAIACRSMRPPSDSYTLIAEFFEPNAPWGRVTDAKWKEIFGIPDDYVIPDQMQSIYDLWRLWHREPERSRRVVRLVLANRHAYRSLPPDRRPPPDLKVTGRYDFYAFGPESPPESRALSPEALDRWLDSSPEARQFLAWRREQMDFLLGGGLESMRDRERASQRALEVLLAGQLYRRDHGAAPPAPEALVGPYLKSLPDAVDDGGDQAMPAGGDPLQ